jgi:hypothetical protein
LCIPVIIFQLVCGLGVLWGLPMLTQTGQCTDSSHQGHLEGASEASITETSEGSRNIVLLGSTCNVRWLEA